MQREGRQGCNGVSLQAQEQAVCAVVGSPLHKDKKFSSATVGCYARSHDAACKLDVLGHDGDALGVGGRQAGVLEQSHQATCT